VSIERLLEPGSIEIPLCRCGAEMRLANGERPVATHETEIRIFRCPVCEHELRLTVWSGFDGMP
jgi:hypothetical protein